MHSYFTCGVFDNILIDKCNCTTIVLYLLYGEKKTNLLNIIIRRYRPGDILNFHSDREDFSEKVFGLVLENYEPERGLILHQKEKAFMLDEKPGLVWCLTGDSRYNWEHGYCTYFKSKKEKIRTSITFRFFNEERLIPNREVTLKFD